MPRLTDRLTTYAIIAATLLVFLALVFVQDAAWAWFIWLTLPFTLAVAAHHESAATVGAHE